MMKKTTPSTADRVLAELSAKNGDAVSGAYLSELCGVSRTAVWKAVSALRERGYLIRGETNSGYRLEGSPDELSAQEIHAALALYREQGMYKTPLEAGRIHVFKETDSTNACARRSLEGGGNLHDLHGSVFCADMQSAGRGRMGRSFYSPSGTGLYLSLIYAPPEGLPKPAVLTASAAVAVCRASQELYGRDCAIKWVNDVYLGGKKIAGILSEGLIDMEMGLIRSAVVGMGVNVRESSYPGTLAETAGALLTRDARDLRRNALAAAIIAHLFAILESRETLLTALEEYRTRSFLIGLEVQVYPLAAGAYSYRARVLAVDDEARLIIERDDGSTEALDSGEVSLHVPEDEKR